MQGWSQGEAGYLEPCHPAAAEDRQPEATPANGAAAYIMDGGNKYVVGKLGDEGVHVMESLVRAIGDGQVSTIGEAREWLARLHA